MQLTKLSSQCCKTVLCPCGKDSPSRNGRTCEGVPQPVSSLQHGLPWKRGTLSLFSAGQSTADWACLAWSFPSGWQSRRTPRLKGSTLLPPALLGANTSRSADILIGPAEAVLDAIPAQPPGDAGAVLVEHGAAAPPLRPTRGAGGHWKGQKTGNRNASAALTPFPASLHG